MPTHIYLWHPIFVHFTLALLSISVLVFVAARLTGNIEWRRRLVAGAELNLWVGTALTVLTVIFGWLAFDSVPHEDTAHGDMELHRALALLTFGWFAVLALFSAWHRRQIGYPSIPFLIAMAIGLVGLLLTGMRGGELVFEHGLGVARATPSEYDSASTGPQSRDLKAASPEQADDGRAKGASNQGLSAPPPSHEGHHHQH